MPSVSIASGTIDYLDTATLDEPPTPAGTTAADKPVVVLLHGLLMDQTLWTDVVAGLSPQLRCVVPTLHLGAHTEPLADGADTSMAGLAREVIDFLDALDLREVILVGNDTGGALAQLVLATDHRRIAAAVLVGCDTFDNLPPGVSGKTLALTAKLPPALFGAFMQQLRLKPARRLPLSFGWLTKRGDRAVASWIKPLLRDRQIRADAVRVIRDIFADRNVLNRAAETFTGFTKPVLVVWASQDRIMPLAEGRRLAAAFPNAELVEVADSYTLIPLDQPAELSKAVIGFANRLG